MWKQSNIKFTGFLKYYGKIDMIGINGTKKKYLYAKLIIVTEYQKYEWI